MQKSYNKTHFFFTYIVFSSVFYIIGLTLCYALPEESSFYRGLENTLTNNLVGNKHISFFRLSELIPVFLEEAKFVIFILCASFTKYRELIFPFLVSYKGFINGIGVCCLMRAIKYGRIQTDYSFIYSTIFVILSVCLISVICWTCVICLDYSRHLIYPLRFNLLIKRKDTYSFLLDILAICGILFIIVFLKIGNFSFMVS